MFLQIKIIKILFIVGLILGIFTSCLKENDLDLDKYDNIKLEGINFSTPVDHSTISSDTLLSNIPGVANLPLDALVPIRKKEILNVDDFIPKSDKLIVNNGVIKVRIENGMPFGFDIFISFLRVDGSIVGKVDMKNLQSAFISKGKIVKTVIGEAYTEPVLYTRFGRYKKNRT